MIEKNLDLDGKENEDSLGRLLTRMKGEEGCIGLPIDCH